MNDSLWAVFEICANLCEALIIFYFICSYLKHNFKTSKGKTIYILGSVLVTGLTTFINHITLYDWWTNIVYIIGWFAISYVLLKGNIITKLFVATLSDVVLNVNSNFVTAFFSVALKSTPIQLFVAQGWYRVLGVLMCQTLNIFLYSLILKIANKTILTMKKKEWLLIISGFLISALSFGVIQSALNEAKLSETISIMLMICEIGLIALNIICLYITISLNKSNRVAEEFKLKEQQLMHDVQYAETVRTQYQEIRHIRHDIKQQLATVSGLQFDGKYDEAQKYISAVTNGIEQIEIFVDAGNDFINAILNSKLSIAKSKGIEVLCNFSGKIDYISEYDLCSLIGNVLDNAIEAAEKVCGAVIEVSLFSDKHKLILTVSNSISQSVLNENTELKTTKSEPELHGFGVRSIRSIAKKYDGIVDFYEEDLTFFCRVVLGKNIEKT